MKRDSKRWPYWVVGIMLILFIGVSNSAPPSLYCDTGDLFALRPNSVTLNTTTLTGKQLENAQTIVSTVQNEGLPERIATLALAVAWQESGLINVPGGTGTSMGLFQQQDGWGTAAQRMDPVWATTAFLRGSTSPKNGRHNLGVVDIHGWETKDLYALGEAVQHPNGGAYASPSNSFATHLWQAGNIMASANWTDNASTQRVASLGCTLNRLSAERLLLALRGQIGASYNWSDGASGGKFDGSGLVYWAFQQIGLTLPRTAEAQWQDGPEVPGSRAVTNDTAAGFKAKLDLLQPGDLVFFVNTSDPGGTKALVSVYAGNGKMIAAPHAGANIRTQDVYQTSGNLQYYGATRPLSNLPASQALPSSTWVTPLSNMHETSPCGMRFHPIYHVWRLHTGEDFGASQGTPVVAAASGTVVDVEYGYNGGAGNYVKIQHSDPQGLGRTIYTEYKHLSAINVTKQQVVTADTQIGLVGATGDATGPHLHFEVIVDGKYVKGLEWDESNGSNLMYCK